MPQTFVNAVSTIEWGPDLTVSKNDKGLITIEVTGYLSGDGLTGEDALNAVPENPPTSVTGYAGKTSVVINGVSARRDASGIYEITATYQGTENEDGGFDSPGGDPDNIRYELRGQASERDITTHPEFKNYIDQDKQNIALLLSGDAFANPLYTGPGTGLTSWEFVRLDKEKHVEVTFTGGENDDTLTAYQMAKRISRGVKTYFAPTVVATRSYTQKEPLSASYLENLGKYTDNPPGDVIQTPAEWKWLVSGLSQTNTAPDVFEISEEFILGEEGAIDTLIYEKITTNFN